MAKMIKNKFPGSKVFFLGQEYTRPLVGACVYVDGFIELNDFLKNKLPINKSEIDAIVHVKPLAVVASHAKKIKIKWRIGTTNRLYHWSTCNKLVKFSRKKSHLHEAQLNLKLLKPFGINEDVAIEEIGSLYGLKKIESLNKDFEVLLDKTKYNLILHPKSSKSAREWGLNNFELLISILDKTRYKIFISGSAEEGVLLKPFFDKVAGAVTNITGKFSLSQFISFIAQCDGIVGCSTGPLHIAAALGKDALGIYAPLKGINAERWAPVGKNAQVFQLNKACTDCYKNKMPCHCIEEVSPFIIKETLDKRNTH